MLIYKPEADNLFALLMFKNIVKYQDPGWINSSNILCLSLQIHASNEFQHLHRPHILVLILFVPSLLLWASLTDPSLIFPTAFWKSQFTDNSVLITSNFSPTIGFTPGPYLSLLLCWFLNNQPLRDLHLHTHKLPHSHTHTFLLGSIISSQHFSGSCATLDIFLASHFSFEKCSLLLSTWI